MKEIDNVIIKFNCCNVSVFENVDEWPIMYYDQCRDNGLTNFIYENIVNTIKENKEPKISYIIGDDWGDVCLGIEDFKGMLGNFEVTIKNLNINIRM